jgi:hypothetical protein
MRSFSFRSFDSKPFCLLSPYNLQHKRFHLDWGKYNHKADKDKEAKAFVEEYTYDPDGFLKWCKSIDEVYIEDEAKSRFFTREILELFKKIPCVSLRFYAVIRFHLPTFTSDDTSFLNKSYLAFHHFHLHSKQFSTVISLDIFSGIILRLQRQLSLICRLISCTMKIMLLTLTGLRLN